MVQDHNYIPREHLLPVYDLGLAHFRDEVVCAAPLQPRIRAAMLAAIARERSGELADRCARARVTCVPLSRLCP